MVNRWGRFLVRAGHDLVGLSGRDSEGPTQLSRAIKLRYTPDQGLAAIKCPPNPIGLCVFPLRRAGKQGIASMNSPPVGNH